MNTDVAVFDYRDHEVQALQIDGEPWFVAKAVCDALRIGNVTKATQYLNDDEKGFTSIHTLGGPQKMRIVNESGLYALIMNSRKAEAKKFRKWVTSEVLPALRKKGSFSLKPATAQTAGELDLIIATAQAMKNISAKVDSQEQELKQLAGRVDEAHGGTDFYTIRGYCRLLNVRKPRKALAKMGKAAAALSRERDIEIGQVPDETWGFIQTYHTSVLEEVFGQAAHIDK